MNISVKISKSITHSLLNDEQLIGGAWIIILNLEANPHPINLSKSEFLDMQNKGSSHAMRVGERVSDKSGYRGVGCGRERLDDE